MSGNSPLKTYGWQILKALVSIGVVVTYSRYLGSDGRGQMSVYLLYLQVIIMTGELLAGSAMANWLVKYKPSQILPWMLLFPLVVIGISGGILFYFFQISRAILWPLLFQGLALAWLNIQFNIYQSQGWIGRRNKLQIVLEALKLLSLIAVIILLPKVLNTENRVEVMLTVLAVVTGVVLIFSFAKTWKIWEHSFPVLRAPKGIFFEGLWAQFGHFVLFFLNKFPLWFVAHFLGDSLAGIFANALLIADTIWIFSGSFGTIIHARVIRNSNEQYHRRLIRRYVDFSLLGTFILCLGVWVIPNGIFVGIFGPNFEDLKFVTMWLFPGILFMGISSSIGNYLHAMNRFKRIFVHHLAAFIVMILVFFGGMKFGVNIQIVAIGMNFGYLVLLILHLYAVDKLVKNDFNLKFNILLIKRLFSIKIKNR